MNKEYVIDKINSCNNYQTNKTFVTKAEYDFYYKEKKVKYESEYVSIIDVPYRRYRLV